MALTLIFAFVRTNELWLRILEKEPLGKCHEELVVKYGGRPDQLSKSEPAIDRYRVLALLKLLCFSDLSDFKQELVSREILKKLEVLRLGAVNRNSSSSSFYSEFFAAFQDLYFARNTRWLRLYDEFYSFVLG